jgi:hypothetical protein
MPIVALMSTLFDWRQTHDLAASSPVLTGIGIGMIAAGVVLAVAVLAVTSMLAVPRIRRYRIAAELRGDWWPRFEREFRAYASSSWQTAREGERHS